MASSGVWENVVLSITPTFDGVCGMFSFTILFWRIAKWIVLHNFVDWYYVNCIDQNDRCCVMYLYPLMLLADVIAKGYDGWWYICDRCYSHISLWQMKTTLFRGDRSVCIVADGKSLVSGWCYCPWWQMLLPLCIGWCFWPCDRWNTTCVTADVINFVVDGITTLLADVIAMADGIAINKSQSGYSIYHKIYYISCHTCGVPSVTWSKTSAYTKWQ